MEALIAFIYVGVIIFNIMFIAKMWRMCNDIHTIMLKLTQQETPNTESKSQQKSGSAAPLMIFFCMGILSVIVLIILFSLNPA